MGLLSGIEIGGVWGAVASICFLALIAVFLYMQLNRVEAIPPGNAVLLFLLITLVNMDFIRFSSIYPGFFFFVWSLSLILERKIFTAFSTLSIAAIFYPPMLYFLPVLLAFIAVPPIDLLRGCVKAFSGFSLPFIYLLTYRWIQYGSVEPFVNAYLSRATDFGWPGLSFHLTTIALALFLFYLFIRSLLEFLKRMEGGIIRKLVKISFIVMFFSLFVFLAFYKSTPELMNIIPALPLSVIITYRSKHIYNRRIKSAEGVLLGILLLLSLINSIV